MKSLAVVVLGFLLASSSAYADRWDYGKNSFGATFGYLDKADDKQFDGSTLGVAAHYVLRSELGEISDKRSCCSMPARNMSTNLRQFGMLFSEHLQAMTATA